MYVPRNWLDIKVCRCSRKAYGIFVSTRSDICQQILVKIANTIFNKPRPVLADLLHANRQIERWTDMTKLKVALQNLFCKCPWKKKFLKLVFFPSSGETVVENEQTVLGPTETAILNHAQLIRKLTTSLAWSNNTAPRNNTHHRLKIVNGNETLISDTSLQMAYKLQIWTLTALKTVKGASGCQLLEIWKQKSA